MDFKFTILAELPNGQVAATVRLQPGGIFKPTKVATSKFKYTLQEGRMVVWMLSDDDSISWQKWRLTKVTPEFIMKPGWKHAGYSVDGCVFLIQTSSDQLNMLNDLVLPKEEWPQELLDLEED